MVELGPPIKNMLESWRPGPQNVTLVENGVTVEVIKVKGGRESEP